MTEVHEKKLRKSANPIIAGVCGGLAEYFETDIVIVRVIFVFLSFLGAGGLILYLILWLIMPEHNSEKTHEDRIYELKEHLEKSHRRAHGMLGFFIILIGVIFLLNNFFPTFGFIKLWPMFLILVGLMLIPRR